MQLIKPCLSLLAILTLTGCGGAGGTVEDLKSSLTEKEPQKQQKIEKKEPISAPKKQPKANTKPIINIPTTIIKEQNIPVEFIANAFDQEGDALSYIWSEKNTILSNKKTFIKDDFSLGEHNITLKVTDARGEFNQENILVTIKETNNKNDAPKAVDQNIVTDEDRTVTFKLNANDLEGDKLTLDIVSNPKHGTITKTGTTITYSPIQNYRGSDEIRYKVNDGKANSNEATVYIKVRAINDAPTVDAGSDKKIRVGHETWMIAKANDSDGSIVKYQWQENNQLLSTKPSFRYKAITQGKHLLKLTVTDDLDAKVSDSVIIDATNKLPLIIIRIEFDDHIFSKDETTWSNKIFGTNEGELNHFYNENSHGRLQFEKAKENQATLNDGLITIHLNIDHPGANNEEIYKDAIALADKYIDFSQYDTDKNDAISKEELQIMFLVAGGENSTSVYPGVWAHATSFIDGPILDGVKVMNHATYGTYSTFGEHHFNNETDASIGIIAHELGHAALGLIDLYDTDKDAQGIGHFGLMGSGNWGKKSQDEYPGTTPISMIAWTKIKSKFVEPIEIKQNKTITLEAATSKDFKPYMIKTTNENEYFLLENRDNIGYDRGLFKLEDGQNFQGGLLITHIDDNIEDNDDVNHKRVDIEEANNAGLDTNTSHRGHINNLYFSGNKDSFTTTSSPNSNLNNGSTSGINITNISDSGQSMSANIEIRK